MLRKRSSGSVYAYVVFFVLPSSLSIFSTSAIAWDCSREVEKVLQRITKGEFTESRSSADYSTEFSEFRLRDDLMDLTAESTWIDMGAGQGRAVTYFYRNPNFRGKVIGYTGDIAYDSADLVAFQNKSKGRFKWMEGRRLESTLETEFPRAKIITDVLGPFSYVKHVDEALQKYLNILETNGTLFIQYTPENNFVRSGLGGSYENSLYDWLQSIDGIRVVQDTTGKKLKITKLKKTVPVPELQFDGIQDGTPPGRRYTAIKKTWLQKVLGN